MKTTEKLVNKEALKNRLQGSSHYKIEQTQRAKEWTWEQNISKDRKKKIKLNSRQKLSGTVKEQKRKKNQKRKKSILPFLVKIKGFDHDQDLSMQLPYIIETLLLSSGNNSLLSRRV